jgi:hypothetical protein
VPLDEVSMTDVSRPWTECCRCLVSTATARKNWGFPGFPAGHTGKPKLPSIYSSWKFIKNVRRLASTVPTYNHSHFNVGPRVMDRTGTHSKGTHHPMDTSSKGRIVKGTHHPRDAESMGHIVQGTHHPRDTSSKEHIIQGTHRPRDAESMGHIVQGTHHPRDASYKEKRSGTHWSGRD